MPLDLPDNSRLFTGPESIDAELARLAAWARVLLSTDDLEDALQAAFSLCKGSVTPLVERVVAGAAPPVALEVLAGVTGVVNTKDYRVSPFWHAAWELLAPAEPAGDEVLEHSLFAALADPKEREEAARRRRESQEAMIAEETARDPKAAEYLRATFRTNELVQRSLKHREGARAAAGEREATAYRIALIGAGGSGRREAEETRQVLWHNREAGPAWEGLCAALDVVGAASFAGLERLGALTDAHPESPALAWLDELASRVAREAGRAAASAARLDALLGSGTFGKNAPELAWAVRYGRKELEKAGLATHDAWLLLGTARRVEARLEDPRDDLSPAHLAAIQRAARAGHPTAALAVAMDATWDRMMAAERREQELLGPFHGLHGVPDEVDEALRVPLHYGLHGFREMHALELLRDGLPRLSAALR